MNEINIFVNDLFFVLFIGFDRCWWMHFCLDVEGWLLWFGFLLLFVYQIIKYRNKIDCIKKYSKTIVAMNESSDLNVIFNENYAVDFYCQSTNWHHQYFVKFIWLRWTIKWWTHPPIQVDNEKLKEKQKKSQPTVNRNEMEKTKRRKK